MRRIDQPELRFMILRAVQLLPRSVLKELQSGSFETRLKATHRAVDIIHERLSFLDYMVPDPIGPHGDPLPPRRRTERIDSPGEDST